MSREEFSHILDILQGRTGYIYYHLMGEPLTHPQLPEFLRMAKEAGFRSVITTNGTLLPKHGNAIIEAGLHKVSISVHSFEGSDDTALERYIGNIAEFADKAFRQGILISLRLWNKGHDGGRNDRILELLTAMLPGDWTPNTRGIRIRDKVYLEWGERFSWPDMEAPDQGCGVYCYGLKDHFGILCDGTVVPCCLDSEGTIDLGNVFAQDLDEILSSSRAEAMVKGFQCRNATEELCRRCGYARRFG